jgi:predicted porin
MENTMIGGLQKNISRLAIIAAAGLMSSTSALSADLGGNCCADLEERVAELEATTARKGNRRVSLSISGHVNEGVMFWDDGVNSDVYVATNVQSRTRFRFKGSATINADWSAGFLLEMGMSRPGASSSATAASDTVMLTDNGIDVRHQTLYLKSKRWGTMHMGHTSDATDGISQICLGCSFGDYAPAVLDDMASSFVLRTAAGGASTTTVGDYFESAEGTRQALVKYTSPTVYGFVLTTNWADEEHDTDDGWGVALRYAGEYGAFRVAGGIGFESQADVDTTGGSLSIAHAPSGLYVAAGGGVEETAAGDDETWHVAAGINRKWNSLGKTHFGVVYGDSDMRTDGQSASMWGFTTHQQIDAAAMEVYVQYYRLDAENDTDGDLQNFDVVYAGARIKF